jgi:hypothetical protein
LLSRKRRQKKMTDAKEDRIKKGKGEMMGNADTEKT